MEEIVKNQFDNHLLVEIVLRVDEFFCNSCGTLMLVKIIPVKVDQSLTGIIRTYKTINRAPSSTCLGSVDNDTKN